MYVYFVSDSYLNSYFHYYMFNPYSYSLPPYTQLLCRINYIVYTIHSIWYNVPIILLLLYTVMSVWRMWVKYDGQNASADNRRNENIIVLIIVVIIIIIIIWLRYYCAYTVLKFDYDIGALQDNDASNRRLVTTGPRL